VAKTDCRPTDYLCYDFFWREILYVLQTQFPRARYLPPVGHIRNQFKVKKWAIELMPIYRGFDLILLVVLLKLNEVI
jgi:hypothetical protein